ncbi:uncharacterized protein LOC110026887 isoform X7 [Phalaenopsis equestris]|uniref:uncharacterized protein LOC110026887 isoform X7 n=1 Tax=Phalaenopsis equestris TaxID=78828 RepID=UPI0009E60B21|nr:uncharacterized protein LOC110026887 isoform X7 [Phalaenopsis equestris]
MRAHIFIKTRKTAASRTRAVEIALVRSPYSLSAQHQSSIPILYCSLSMPILVSPPRGIGAFLISPLLDIGTYHLLDLHILVLSICAQIPSKSASGHVDQCLNLFPVYPLFPPRLEDRFKIFMWKL